MAFIQYYQTAFVEIVAFFDGRRKQRNGYNEERALDTLWTDFALYWENQQLSHKSVHKEMSLKLVGEKMCHDFASLNVVTNFVF